MRLFKRPCIVVPLTPHPGLNYLVKINTDGKLYWAKNNQLVDTSAGDWKDAGHGQGIVPENLPSRPVLKADAPRTDVPFAQSVLSDSDADSAMQSNAAMHYAGPSRGKYRWTRYLRRHFTPKGVMQRLLRKTVKRNTWIYVSVCYLDF